MWRADSSRRRSETLVRHDHASPGLAREDARIHQRIALVYRSGDPPERAWSGIPAGLKRGLTELGHSADLINVEPRRGVVRAAEAWAMVARGHRFGGTLAPEIRALRRATARRRGSPVQQWDAAVQMGSDFGVPFPRRIATFEDITVRQLTRVLPLEETLGAAGVERWIEAQAACYDAARACCAASRWVAESIIQDYGVDPAKVHVVGFGRNYEARPVTRDWASPRFLFVGYDWDRKNGPMLLRVFARVREKVPSARLDVVGGHARIELDGVDAHGALAFSVPEERARVEALYETATCFVMPSKLEPFGMAFIEAAAAGVPSIGTTVGGATDLIGQDGGLVVDPTSEDALVEAMISLCDPERASRMGAAAHERSALFTWHAVAERIMTALGLGQDATVERLHCERPGAYGC